MRHITWSIAALSCACGLLACADILDIPSDRYVSASSADGGDAGDARCTGNIEVRIIIDVSGPTKTLGAPYLAGEQDYFRELNEGGGIKGCHINFVSTDYGYKADNARQVYESWKADPTWPQVVAVLGYGTPDTLGLADQVAADKKPLLGGQHASLASPDAVSIDVTVPEIGQNFARNTLRTHFATNGYPYNFFAFTDYSTGARIAMFHIKTLGGKRVGFFVCDDPYCTGPAQAARVHAESLGLDIGRVLPLQQSGQDQAAYDAAVLQYFKDEQAHKKNDDPNYNIVDWVWGGNTTTTSVQMAIALSRMKSQLAGTTPAIPNVQLILNNNGFSEDMYTICGTPCVDAVHGIVPYTPYGDTSRGSSEMGRLTALHDKWRQIDSAQSGAAPASYKTVRYVQGYINATLFRLGVEAVVNQRKPVTGENLRAALETFRNVDMGGLTDRLSYSEKDHRPQSTEAIYKIGTDGSLVREPPDRTISLENSWLGW
ncbi:ABC transporter substrate-binding protein [Pendulispora brunnea]|uniref:ABC transporter substrate-binding protein n=1 Tax=Pendulispora brunnea TaxID=2905690 RepID=A0ABZ2K4P9_9BACT